MQQIQLNIIPFTPVANKATFSFYGEKQKGFAPIYWGKIMDAFPKGREAKYKNYYTDFQEAREGAITKEIKFADAINFSLHYFRHLVFNYFKGIEGAVVFPNYVDDIEVWFKDPLHKNKVYQLYNNFTIKVQFNQVTPNSYEFVLAYNGTSKILHKSIAEIDDFDTTKFNLINCNGTVYKYEKMPDDLRQNQETLYPILSNRLKKEFLTDKIELKPENRFPIYLKHLEAFYKAYLNTAEFKKLFKLSGQGFYQVPNNKVFETHSNSNLLEFKDGKTEVNPGIGIWKHKPLKAFTEDHVKLFFIYHKDDGEYIKDTLYDYLVNGWHKPVKNVEKHIANLKNYINQPFSIDKDKRIVFENKETIFEEVAAQLKDFNDTSSRFVAIYISPISKTETDHPQHFAYYKIKELLLNKGISSQVVFKEHLSKEEFYYFIPNIYVALLAKIGGIPWRLARTKEDEIIIGVGAFKPQGSEHRFVGSAFCFSNDGTFENFNCFREDEPEMLAGSISNAVEKYIEKNNEAKRVIIHFYKEISDKKELQPILKMLDNLGERDLPVIVVTINKTDSKELLGFDMGSVGKMPRSGRYVKVGYNSYLLFNNTRYFEDSKLFPKDYHFPIKVSITATKIELVEDVEVVRELIDQVYQFSRMYWKSISQQNLPVTTKYPEMVAEIYPHFQEDNLPDFGKSNLWFL
jgi:hypothetical protein